MSDKYNDLLKMIADLNKAVKESKDNATVNKENLEKMAKEIADAQVKLRTDAMRDELRKGSFSQRRDEDVKPHEMIVEKSDDPKVQAFQNWNDDVYLLSKILGQHPKTLKTWQKYAAKHSDLRKAMDTAEAAGGLEWIPTDFSSELIRRIDLATKVAGLFPKIQMPTDPYKLPTLLAHPTAYKVNESTADGAMTGASAFTNSAPTSGNITLDAKKMGVATEWSMELQEDSIIPVLPLLKSEIALALAFAMEDAILNGDTAGTHQDADVTAAADVRKLWDGLRKTGSANSVDGSTHNLSVYRSARRLMGRYGAELSKLVWLVSPKGWVLMQGLDEVTTVEKYGPNATVLQGELGRLDGIPIIVSEKMRDDLNNNGVNDSTTNTKGQILLVRTDCFLIGEKRKVTTKSFEDIRRDQFILVNTWRGDFVATQPTTDPLVVRIRNLTV